MSDFVIVSENINEYFEKELRKCGLNVIKVRKNRKLYTAIETHPDIVLCPVGKNIVIEADSYDYLLNELSPFNYNLIKADALKSGKYPDDIKLNLAYTGRFAIHNLEYTDKKLFDELLKISDKSILKFINVKQGYSKCSVLIVDDESIITSDNGIYLSLKDQMNCLLIERGHIKLENMEYGFIGGASGRYKDEIWFYGDISKHPDYKIIKDFIKERRLKLRFFKEFELEDIGSIFFFGNI